MSDAYKKTKTGNAIEHTALYRKYRPADFAAVKGQEQVVTALEGAIAKAQIPHALLFTGSRGTGKTSVARIFAQAIGTTEIDTYEIDAASNRGIDDVRMLREAVMTLPYESKQKVYIIDEVHMLTKEAFNALLKTLEEPPAHVIFILATTEADKLLETITSRCQVYRFRAPTRAILRDAVLDVAKKEGFILSPDGADLVAIAADGSFRDALGITQKVITASLDTKADADEVAMIVGAPRGALIMEIILGMHAHDSERALCALREAGEAAVDMKLFSRLLLERMRAVILLRNAPSEAQAAIVSYTDEDRESLGVISQDPKTLINSRTLLRFLDAVEHIGKTHIPSLPLELAVVDVCGTKTEGEK